MNSSKKPLDFSRSLGYPGSMGSLIHRDFVNTKGLVTDQPVETYYAPMEEVQDFLNGRYLRVVADAGPWDVEVRVPYRALEELGWVKASFNQTKTS